MLDAWLYDDKLSKIHSNTQVKFITNKIDLTQYNKNLVTQETINNNWFIGQEENINKAKDFIDKNVILFTDNLDKDFNIENAIHINKSGKKPEVTKKQYDRIVELNSLDIELYGYASRTKKY
jgi:acid phosphatase class B